MRYKYTITDSVVAYRDILILTLTPQSNEDTVMFEPGQYVALGFKRHGRLSPMRCFTIASSPTDGTLRIAMRISGKFTRAAAQLKTGTTIYVQGPFGEFVLGQATGHIVMLAGGIGITPFMSMLRYATETRLNTPITLVYTNRFANEIPFFDELQEMARRNPLLKIAFFASQGDTTGRIVSGNINQSHIKQLTTQAYTNSTYFLCGPPRFMDGMQAMLEDQDILPEQIITESFAQKTQAEIPERFSATALTYGAAFAAFAVLAGGILALDVHKTVEAAWANGTITAQAPVPTTDTSTLPSDATSQTSNPTTDTTTQQATTYYQQPRSRMS